MANRYWVGGTAAWDSTVGTKWALTSGGAGGQSVPTSADDVFFDAASGVNTVTISTGNTGAKSINCTGFTGTLAGTTAITVSGSVTLATGMTYSHSGTVTFNGTGTLITAGKTFSPVIINGAGITVTLGGALTVAARSITVTQGTLDTAGFNVTASIITSNNTNTRSIIFGASTLTLNGATIIDFTNSSNLTFNAGTSQITCIATSSNFYGGGQTFYNLSWNAASGGTLAITGANTFNNLSIAARTSTSITTTIFYADQVVNGTLTVTAGANATIRNLFQSPTFGTTATLTLNAVSAGLADIDFIDIAILGSAAPISGTRFGNGPGNTGITFTAGVNKYWNSTANSDWSSISWATSAGGAVAINNFPLAQDTCIFTTAAPVNTGGITLDNTWLIGSIDMSARIATSSTMTFSFTLTPIIICGNFTAGTGVTFSTVSSGRFIFSGRSSHTINTNGRIMTMAISIEAVSGTYTLLSALSCSSSLATAFYLGSGTFNSSTYNVSLTASPSSLYLTGSRPRTLNTGSSTWTISGSTGVNATDATNLTVAGTGILSLTSTSSKSFIGGNVQTWPTVNQGGTGQLTISGSNKFANITNTAIGNVRFTGGTTNEFTAFNLNGTSTAARLILGSSNTIQAILKKPSAWLMGAGSLNSGNNTGLTFAAGGGIDFLSVNYINGVVISSIPTTTNLFFLLF